MGGCAEGPFRVWVEVISTAQFIRSATRTTAGNVAHFRVAEHYMQQPYALRTLTSALQAPQDRLSAYF